MIKMRHKIHYIYLYLVIILIIIDVYMSAIMIIIDLILISIHLKSPNQIINFKYIIMILFIILKIIIN